MKLRFGSLILFLGALLAAGCGPAEAEVSGTVLIDGKLLEEGKIIFEEVDKSKTPAMGDVVDGKYKLKVLPGSKAVRITASRATKIFDPVMGATAREPMIREEYNEHTILKAEVLPGKQDGVNFAVQSIP